MPKKEQRNRTPYIDKIIKQYLRGTSKFYPGFKFASRRSIYSGVEPTSCDFEFRFNAKNLSKTEYECLDRSLIHYTSSINNLFEILNSGVLRLSNLNVLNDPQELTYMVNSLGMQFNKDQVHEYKSHFFSSSFCKIADGLHPDIFPMWRLYGDDGYGAAIIFEVENIEADWSNFLLAKVQYGNNAMVNKFKQFTEFHNAFQSANNNPIQNYPLALASLLTLHKNDIWGYENEIRLLSHHSFDKYNLKTNEYHLHELKHAVSIKGGKYSYVELPIIGGEKYNDLQKLIDEKGYGDYLQQTLPLFKIKEIVLGYRLNAEIISDIFDVTEYLANIYKYKIKVSVSHLREFMN